MKVYDDDYSLVKSFQPHKLGITGVKQIPFNDYVVTTDIDEVKIWDPTNNIWSLIRTYNGHQGNNPVYGIEYLNKDIIATGGDDSLVKIWSINTGQTLRTINTNGYARVLLLLSNGFHLAVGHSYQTHTIEIFNINTGCLLKTLEHSTGISDLKMIGHDLLVSSTFDSKISFWNLTTNATKFVVQGGGGGGLKVLSSDIIVSGSGDYAIKFWNVTSGHLVRNITENTNPNVVGVDLIDSDILVAAFGDESIMYWNLKTGQCLKKIQTDISIFSMVVINQTTNKTKSK